MARKTFLFYLFNADKKPLYVDDAGIVTPGNDNWQKADGQPAHLKVSIDGWGGMVVKYARNIKYWGVFRDMTLPLRFVKDGAKIVKWSMWQTGIETVLHFALVKLNRLILPYQYESWYISELNFLKYRETKDAITIEALEGGLVKYLKAFENTVYEIDISNDPQKVFVEMDGMELVNNATFAITNGLSADSNATRQNHLVALTVVDKEVQDIGGVFDVDRIKTPGIGTPEADEKYFFKATSTGTIKPIWNFDVRLLPIPGANIGPATDFRIRIVATNDNNENGDFAYKGLTLRAWSRNEIDGTIYRVEGEGELDVVPGDELYMLGFSNVVGATGDAEFEVIYTGAEPTFKLEYTYRHPASVVEGLLAYRLVEKVLEKVSDGQYTIKSEWLSAFKDVVLVSGDSLRGLSPAVIKTSYTSFFKSFKRYCIGCGIRSNQLEIELLKFFFSDEVIMDLGEVGEITIEPAEDLMGNTLKAGYKVQEYNGINGRTEFNQGQIWTLPITKKVEEIDLSSDYRADAFGAELTRINYGKLKTTDSRADNDTWMLAVKPNSASFTIDVSFNSELSAMEGQNINQFVVGQVIQVSDTQFNNGRYTVGATWADFSALYILGSLPVQNEGVVTATINIIEGARYKLHRPAFTSVTGLLKPETMFNIPLRPRLGIINNGALLHSLLDLLDTKQIKLQSADKNTDLVTSDGLQTITEKEPIQIGNLPPKLFRPYYLNFVTKVPINLLAIMEKNPYGKIRFTSNGQTFLGCWFDGSIKPADNDTQTWKLLSGPDNDLSKVNKNTF